MKQPTSFKDKDKSDDACLLNKAIYGLKHALRAWNFKLQERMMSDGFKNSIADASVFLKISDTTKLFVLVYVDDIVVIGRSIIEIDKFIASICESFSCGDMVYLSYFLGLECIYQGGNMILSQEKYAREMLKNWMI